MKVQFNKYQANGNDFIIVKLDAEQKIYFTPQIIQRLCNRHFGIGADGLFIITPSKQYDFNLDYYNSDGSWETFCGNGSRCAILFMSNYLKKNTMLTFKTGSGLFSGKLNNNSSVLLQFQMPIYKSDLLNIHGVKGYFINSGAKHFVCESKILDDDYVYNTAQKIRYAKKFQPNGINVNFYKRLNTSTIEIKTYEKGIEQIMTSCSSGSAAVVFHLSQKSLIKSPVTTISPGGHLKYTYNKNWSKFICKGDAKISFRGKFNLKNYQSDN